MADLNRLSAEANITFTPAPNAASANFVFYRQPNRPGGRSGSAFFFDPNATTATVNSGSLGQLSNSAFIAIDTTVPGFGPITDSLSTGGGGPYAMLVHEEGHLIGLGPPPGRYPPAWCH